MDLLVWCSINDLIQIKYNFWPSKQECLQDWALIFTFKCDFSIIHTFLLFKSNKHIQIYLQHSPFFLTNNGDVVIDICNLNATAPKPQRNFGMQEFLVKHMRMHDCTQKTYLHFSHLLSQTQPKHYWHLTVQFPNIESSQNKEMHTQKCQVP